MSERTVWEAGRELDAEIAEKVMGLVVDRDWPVMYAGGDCFSFEPQCDSEFAVDSIYDRRQHVAHRYRDDGSLAYREEVLAYSTDIGAAWSVVEKMRERFPRTSFELKQHDKPAWRAIWWDAWGNCRDGRADVAPLAICRAALSVLSPEVTPNE